MNVVQQAQTIHHLCLCDCVCGGGWGRGGVRGVIPAAGPRGWSSVGLCVLVLEEAPAVRTGPWTAPGSAAQTGPELEPPFLWCDKLRSAHTWRHADMTHVTVRGTRAAVTSH